MTTDLALVWRPSGLTAVTADGFSVRVWRGAASGRFVAEISHADLVEKSYCDHSSMAGAQEAAGREVASLRSFLRPGA